MYQFKMIKGRRCRLLFGILLMCCVFVCYFVIPFNESVELNLFQFTKEDKSALIELPNGDFEQLIDLHDFKFIKNHQSCNEMSQQPEVLILIHSAPMNFNKRKVIRETWGRKDPRALLLFLIGTVSSEILQRALDVENAEENDFVQGNFVDVYRNLTYKHVMAFKWFVYNCPGAKYLLKGDDDTFVNTPFLYNYLANQTTSFNISCNKVYLPGVCREPGDKWFVTREEFSDDNYPDYCLGFTIIYSGQVIHQLYLEAQKLPYFWVDDAHVSGTVRSNLNIEITRPDELILNWGDQRNLVEGIITVDSNPFLFLSDMDKSEEMIRKLWKRVQPSNHYVN